MNDPHLPDLPPDIAALLDASRSISPAPASARRRVASRLALTLGLSIPSASLAVTAGASRVLAAKLVGAALVLGAGVGVARSTLHREPPAATAPPRSAAASDAPRATRPTAPPAAAPLAPQSAPSASVATVAAPPRTLVAAPHATRRGEVARGDDGEAFHDELRLIERAHAALTAGEVDRASAALTEHAARFSRGHFAPEREALRVRCLSARGDRSAAESARQSFHRRFPDSVLGATVDRAVDPMP